MPGYRLISRRDRSASESRGGIVTYAGKDLGNFLHLSNSKPVFLIHSNDCHWNETLIIIYPTNLWIPIATSVCICNFVIIICNSPPCIIAILVAVLSYLPWYSLKSFGLRQHSSIVVRNKMYASLRSKSPSLSNFLAPCTWNYCITYTHLKSFTATG